MNSLRNRYMLYWKYLYNCFRTGILRIKYGNRFCSDRLLCFDKNVNFSISGNGTIQLGAKSSNRGTLFLSAHNGKIQIGNHCFFNANCSITSVENIQIGNECKLGNNVVVVDHDHNYKRQTNEEFISSPITIGDDVWIGAGSIILRGTHIGDHCVIAAGSIVREDIPDNCLYFNPNAAKGVIRKI